MKPDQEQPGAGKKEDVQALASTPNSVGQSDLPSTNPANLSPDEQMAQFEEHLKESDWGHQPC